MLQEDNLMLHIVIVLSDNMLTNMVPVLIVDIDVNIVKPNKITVLYVLLTELTSLNVTVLMDTMITVITQNVNHVNHTV